MSLATVYGAAQFGLASETSATGIAAASVSFTGSSSEAEGADHLGCVVALGIYNPMKEVTVSGIIATKGTGLVDNIGSTITLANSTHNTRTRLTEGLGESIAAASGAAIIITGNSITGSATGFEEGEVSGKFYPFVAAGTVTALT